MKVFVDYNTMVERNALLAEIDPKEYKTRLDNEQAGLNRAKAELEQALAKVKLAKSELETAQQANDKVKGSISAADLRSLETSYHVAKQR